LPVGLLLLAAALAAPAVERWSPPRLSSPQFESHAAFDPRNGDFYFVRSTPAFEGWRLFASRCDETGWSEPRPPVFAGDGVEADPWFTPDGRSLYFISTRSTDGVHRADLDIWRVDRRSDQQWGVPKRLPVPPNSTANEWFPRIAVDGWIYFGSGRPGGFGKTDIWRAKQGVTGSWQVDNLGRTINTADDEFEAAKSPDGKTLIIMASSGLYESTATRHGWRPRHRLGSDINVNGTEVGALFSPSGRSVLFARDTHDPLSGEFFVWRRRGSEQWPPTCSPTRGSPLALPH
jgi:hypothetical protein